MAKYGNAKMNITLKQGNCLELIKEIPDNSVDSIITDPPYELGFMGKDWDKTGIANNIELWKECLRVLKHGGYLLSFGGTRTYHRMACAIEDAGFEIRDMIEWVYGSGFPKSLNIGKAVDKLQGNEREKIWYDRYKDGGTRAKQEIAKQNIPLADGRNGNITTKGTSEWEGCGTALKPAHEPICMARKPLSEKTVAENVLKWGTGGINIDASRVGYQNEKDKKEGQSARPSKTSNKNEYSLNHGGLEGMDRSDRSNITGRFPANLIHDNSDEVRECFPNESERFFKSIIYQSKASKRDRNTGCDGLPDLDPHTTYANDEWSRNHLGNTPINKREPVKNNHPTVKPIALMEYLINMVTQKNGTVLDPFMGSGSTGIACKNLERNFIGFESNQGYFELASHRIHNSSKVQSELL